MLGSVLRLFSPPAASSVAPSVPASSGAGDPDCKAAYEREKARADAAEARAEDLRWQEVRARAAAHQYRQSHEKARAQLEASRAEVEDIRKTARDALFWQEEAARLNGLLAAAQIDPRKRTTIEALRQENGALRAEKAALEAKYDASQAENAALKARTQDQALEIEKLRSTKSTLSKGTFGSKSEKQKKEPTGRKRGAAEGIAGSRPKPAARSTENGRSGDPSRRRTNLPAL